MSLYRTIRASALVVLLVKYRVRIYWICAALAVALVTDWMYDDIAEYYKLEDPSNLQGWVLAVKTAVVYAALAYILWQFRFAAKSSGKTDAVQNDKSPIASGEGGPLNELLDKPKLRSRAEFILESRKGDAE